MSSQGNRDTNYDEEDMDTAAPTFRNRDTNYDEEDMDTAAPTSRKRRLVLEENRDRLPCTCRICFCKRNGIEEDSDTDTASEEEDRFNTAPPYRKRRFIVLDTFRAPSLSGKSYFGVTEISRKEAKESNATEIIFDVIVYKRDQKNMIDCYEGFERLFGAVLEKVSGDLGPNGMIWLCIVSDTLENGIGSDFLPKNQMTPEKIVSAIQNAFPSEAKIPMNDEDFSIHVITVKKP